MNTTRVLTVLSLLTLVQGCGQATGPSAVASTAPPPDPLVFDTWVPGPCSPNGQPQGPCPPGELFRVRLVRVAEGLTYPRHVAVLPGGEAGYADGDEAAVEVGKERQRGGGQDLFLPGQGAGDRDAPGDVLVHLEQRRQASGPG